MILDTFLLANVDLRVDIDVAASDVSMAVRTFEQEELKRPLESVSAALEAPRAKRHKPFQA
jgi:hypothetical protein